MQVAAGICAAAATAKLSWIQQQCSGGGGCGGSGAVGGKNRVKFKIQLMMLKVILRVWMAFRIIPIVCSFGKKCRLSSSPPRLLLCLRSVVWWYMAKKFYRIDFNSALKPTMCNGEKNISYGEFFSWHCIFK